MFEHRVIRHPTRAEFDVEYESVIPRHFVVFYLAGVPIFRILNTTLRFGFDGLYL
jgi:hypothetical protein